MAWYVFALADCPPRAASVRGFTSAVTFRRAAGFYAAVERRGDVPPADLGSLERHQRVVERLAGRVPAILPVRFGTLLTADAIDESLEPRREDIAEALGLVRARRQMTWRLSSSLPAPNRRRETRVAFTSGAEYLRHAAKPASVPLPSGLRQVRTLLGPLAAAEREGLRTHTLPPTLYHLVDRTVVKRYIITAESVRVRFARLVLSGPWAPYAFTPELF